MTCQFCGRSDATVVRGAAIGGGRTKREAATQRFATYHVECREDFAADEAARHAKMMRELREEIGR